MNYRSMAHYVGLVLRLESVFMLLSFCVSLYCGEPEAMKGLLISAAATFAAGFVLGKIGPTGRVTYVREGFMFIAISWIAMSVMGALPFWLCGAMDSFIDCLFESVSGFTTTAASIVRDIHLLPKGLLFWRSVSLWIGGMGVLVFLMAASMIVWGQGRTQSLGAETPGPSPGKLAPKLRTNARLLYGIYFGLTLLQMVLLLLGGLPLFDSIVTAMSTAGTGGFGLSRESIALYDSVYVETVIVVFMVLCGINFNIHYFVLCRNFSAAAKNDELKVYLGMIGLSSLLVTANLWLSGHNTPLASLRYGVFQVVSVVTTTGFTTTDIATWPLLSKMILFVLMFIGACAGSSGGGLKVARIVLVFRDVQQSVLRMMRPRAVSVVKLDGKAVDNAVMTGTYAYLSTFFFLYIISFLLISIDGLGFENSLSAVAASINNVGAGLGIMSEGRYELFSPLSKIVLLVDMLLGRLELYPILLLSPRMWRKI